MEIKINIEELKLIHTTLKFYLAYYDLDKDRPNAKALESLAELTLHFYGKIQDYSYEGKEINE